MTSVKIVRALAGAVIALAAIVPAVSAAPNPIPIHLVKDCSTYDGETPSLCTISSSDMSAITVGTKVWYQGPVLTNNYFLSSNVQFDVGNGSTARGYCIFDARATESTGLCTFWSGTGNLAGFTSILHVTIDAQGEWHLDGIYYIDAEVIVHSVTSRAASPRPS